MTNQNTQKKPGTQYLDCSHETTEVRSVNKLDRAWFQQNLQSEDWFLNFSQSALDEVHKAADLIQKHPVDGLRRSPADIDMPECKAMFTQVRHILDKGVGFAVVDRLPVDDYPLEILVEIYWILGQLVGKPVAQKRSGQMIYDVKDTTKAFQYGVRGSWTNVELNFHTDNAFGRTPPEYVGLFCRHPAREGGVSRFCSLYALHQELETVDPNALARLYQPMLYDRQKEHLEGEPPVTLAPFFSWKENRLQARANTSLVRKGYEVAGETMDQELNHALSVLDDISAKPQFWFEAALEAGQIQYLNNSEVGHYRSEFEDFDDDAKKRHLFRLWHRNEGSVAYDGYA